MKESYREAWALHAWNATARRYDTGSHQARSSLGGQNSPALPSAMTPSRSVASSPLRNGQIFNRVLAQLDPGSVESVVINGG